MTNTTITALPAGSTLSGTEVLPMDQGVGPTTAKVTAAALAAYAKSAGNLTAPVPLPFVGTAPVVGWTRPSLATFLTWLNQGGQLTGVGTNGAFNNGAPVTPGTGYAPGDVSTLAGGTGTAAT